MKQIYILLLVCLTAGGCNKFDDAININPNLPNTASGTQLIANAQLSLPGLSSSPTGEFMAQYLAETQYVGASLYPEGGTSFYGLYQGPLMNLQTVINSDQLNGNEGPVDNQLAVAKILKAYFFWHITDRWGPVPYQEALQGEKDFTPAYDTQESVYNSLFQLLDEADKQIIAGSISNDIVYSGNMTRWKKLGNTIRLLMALRLSEVNPEKGKEEFNKALAAGIMTGNEDNLVYKHLADANNQNYWYGQIVGQNRQWWALTETLVDAMKPVGDPRLPVFGSPASESGEYVGLKFGTQDASLLGTTEYSLLGGAIFAQDAGIQLVTYAQALFAKAEAAERGWISGGNAEAERNYNLAIENSILQWTGSKEGADDFLSRSGIKYDPVRAIEQIAVQRWIHLFMHGYEGWAEWRRTGYPDNLVSPAGVPVPLRQSYPADERFNNTENYNQVVQSEFNGQDDQSSRLWWDK